MNFTRKAAALALTLGTLAASTLSGCYDAAYVPARAVYYNNGYYAQPGYAAGYYARPGYGYYNRPGYYAPGYARPAYAAPVYARPAYAAPVYSRPAYVAPRSGGFVRRW